jgi:hypothetical protein
VVQDIVEYQRANNERRKIFNLVIYMANDKDRQLIDKQKNVNSNVNAMRLFGGYQYAKFFRLPDQKQAAELKLKLSVHVFYVHSKQFGESIGETTEN